MSESNRTERKGKIVKDGETGSAHLLFLSPREVRGRIANRRGRWTEWAGEETTEPTHRQMGRLTGRLTSCEQQGVVGQVSNVTLMLIRQARTTRAALWVLCTVPSGILPLFDLPVLLSELGRSPSPPGVSHPSYRVLIWLDWALMID